MLDIKFIRDNAEAVKDSASKKRLAIDIDRLLSLDEQRRKLQSETEALRAQKNQLSKDIPRLAKENPEAKDAAMAQVKTIGEREKQLSTDLEVLSQEYDTLMLRVPNLLDPEVPVGKDDTENKELYRRGELPSFNFEPLDHVELGRRLDILDVERGVRISGSRFYFLKNEGALLELAVLRLALDRLVQKGFTPFLPPLLVKHEAMEGTGYFPGGEEQAYAMEKDGLYLIGTSEVPVASYHYDEILPADQLPKLYAGYSPCFRREAGTYGKDTKGIYRIHQFQKVEQVILCKNDAEESAHWHKVLLQNAEELLELLGLPYRVVDVCSGDLGQGQMRKFDIETWMPSRNAYGETHSCSKFHEFQARRLKTRYKDKDGKMQFVHTLNNTLVASPRILIPLLEIHQNADGSVTIPEVLRPYMLGKERILPRQV